MARRGCRLPLQARRWVAVRRLTQCHKVGVVIVVVFHQDSLILQPNDSDLVVVALEEGGDA